LSISDGGFQGALTFFQSFGYDGFRVATVRRAGYGAGYHAAAGERFAQTAKFD